MVSSMRFLSIYLASVLMLATGCSSRPCCWSSRARSQSSSLLSPEKSTSTAPARVPVTKIGLPAPGDQAKEAVRGISRRRTMMAMAGSYGPMRRQDQLRMTLKYDVRAYKARKLSITVEQKPCSSQRISPLPAVMLQRRTKQGEVGGRCVL